MTHASGNPTWQDWPSHATPVTATSLENLEAAVDAVMALGTTNDAVTANLIANPATATRSQINTLVKVPKDRQRVATMRSAPKAKGRYVIPSGFGWDPGIPILWDGRQHSTPYDVSVRKNTGGTTRYVDPSIGSPGDSNLGTAVATLASALAANVAVTSISVTATTSAIGSGRAVAVISGTNFKTFVTSGAVSLGATSIPVVSATPAAAFAVGSTVAAPHRTVSAGITNAVDGDSVVILPSGPIWRGEGPGNTNITKSVNLIGLNRPIITTADLLSWTVTAGRTGVYESARTNVRKVVDLGVDADGFEYTRVTSVALVEANPMTWYQATDGTGSVYVHTYSGGAPDPLQVLALLAADHFLFNSTGRASDQRVYVENIRVIGGQGASIQMSANDSRVAYFTTKNCELLHGGYGAVGAVATALANGFQVYGNVISFAQSTRTAYTGRDGFNYHAGNGYIPKMVEIDCEAHDNGTGQISQDAGVDTSQNGSTLHEGALGVRIGCRYHDAYGTPVADVHVGTKSLNLSCDVWVSTATSGTLYNGGISAQQAGTEMWVSACRIWGTENDIYCFTGSTVHVLDATEYDSVGGSGVITYS